MMSRARRIIIEDDRQLVRANITELVDSGQFEDLQEVAKEFACIKDMDSSGGFVAGYWGYCITDCIVILNDMIKEEQKNATNS